MSRTFQPKHTPVIKTSCDSYIRTISELRNTINDLEIQRELLKQDHKQEAFFLRGAIAIALFLGFVVGVIFSKGF